MDRTMSKNLDYIKQVTTMDPILIYSDSYKHY